MSNFVHLHNHTNEGSFMDAPMRIKELVAKAKEENMPAVAITDHGSILGWYEFARECEKAEIKPIFGVELYESLATNASQKLSDLKKTTKSKEDDTKLKDNYHIVFLAKNEEGVKWIRNAVTYANGKHTKYNGRGRIDTEYMLKNQTDDVFCLTGCIGGKIGNYFSEALEIYKTNQEVKDKYLKDAEKKAKSYLNTLCYAFGKDNVYIEMQKHNISKGEFENLNDNGRESVSNLLEIEELVRRFAYKMQNDEGYNIVATNDIHYLKEEDTHLRNIATAMLYNTNYKQFLQDGKGIFDCHFKTEEEMSKNFFPVALDSTIKIANSVEHVKFTTPDHYLFPKITDGDAKEALRDMVLSRSFSVLGRDFTEEEQERLYYELSVIDKIGANDYFLITTDIVDYAKKQGIPYSPRGSAGASFVLYLLGIAKEHPMENGFIFERFLNPERVTMADIDLDFSSDGQRIIRHYMAKKYGAEHTALIRTIGTWQGSEVLNRFAKSFDAEKTQKVIFDVKNRLKSSKLNDLEELLKIDAELKKLFETDSIYNTVLGYSLKLQGLNFNESKHAGGLIVANRPLREFSSVSWDDKENMPIIDLDKVEAEKQKLTKIDILSVKILDIIYGTLRDIGENDSIFHTKEKDVFEWMIENPDRLFTAFQLSAENSGIVSLLKQAKPSSIRELSDIISLYRPGAMGYIDSYIKRKDGVEPIVYTHEDLIPFLIDTQGIVIYQEQILQVVQKFAGFSLAEADLLRKAISSKDADLMANSKNEFIERCTGKGYSYEIATKLADDIAEFAKYGFNLPHGMDYANTCYSTAYLIKNYPYEWYKNVLEAKSDERTYRLIAEKEKDRILLNQLSVNSSSLEPTIVANEGGKYLDFGFSSIKGISSDISTIQEYRKMNDFKRFESLESFIRETEIKKGNFEKLALCGVLDEFGFSRSWCIENFKNLKDGELTVEVKPFSKIFEVRKERELLVHKAVDFEEALVDVDIAILDKDSLSDKQSVVITGYVDEIDIFTIKNGKMAGKPMAVYKLTDIEGTTWDIVNFNPTKSDLNYEGLEFGFITVKGIYGAEKGNIIANREAGHKLFYSKANLKNEMEMVR